MKMFSLLWRYPFDWRNPYGYLVAFSLQYALMSFGIKHATCHTGFIGGSCWMLISFTEDLKNELNTLNTTIGKKGQLNAYKEFSEFLQYHAMAKQFSFIRFFIFLYDLLTVNWYFHFRLVNDFTEAYKHIILFFFLWSTITTAGALLVIRIVKNFFLQKYHHSKVFKVYSISRTQAI